VRARRERDRGRRGRVPGVLASSVDEQVGLAGDDGRCLRAGGAERDELAADRLGEGLRE